MIEAKYKRVESSMPTGVFQKARLSGDGWPGLFVFPGKEVGSMIFIDTKGGILPTIVITKTVQLHMIN